MMLGVKKCEKVTEPDFSRKLLFGPKSLFLGPKWPKLVFFALYSKTALRIFLKFGMMLGVKKCKNVTEPDFSRKLLFGPKSLFLGPKWPKLVFFALYSKTALRIFLKFGMMLGVKKCKKVT